jgi:hypothetical protein
MERTYITDQHGQDLGNLRIHPDAAFHFANMGTNAAGASIWQASEIHHGHMRLTPRLVFTSYYNDSSRAFPMAWLLFRQMLAHEATQAWEAKLKKEQATSMAA